MRTLEVVILQKWVTGLRDLMGEFFMKAELLTLMDKRQKESSFVNQEQLIHFQLYVTGFLEIKCNWLKNKAKILKMPEVVRVKRW